MGGLNLEYFLARRMASASSGRRNNVMVRVATLSVAIGVAVMIVSLAVIFGFKREITAKLSGFGAHVQIASLDGNASSYETEPVSRDQPFADYLRGIPCFGSINPYAVKGGILRGEEAMQGIVLKGVDSTYDWTPMRRSLVAGRLPDVSDTVRHKEVLLSRAVADRMEADVGDPIEMLFVQNPPRRDRFRVSGIYDTGFGELDRVLALTDLRNVQRLNGWDSTQVSGFELRTTDFSRLDRFTDDVYRAVVEHQRTDRDEPLRVTNVRMQYPMIFDWLDAHNVNAAVIITVMLLVAQVGVDDRSLFDGDVGIDALALHRMRVPYDGCFCDLRVRDERAFNFGRADAVARHVHHVVDATRDPEVAILVSIGAIAREVVAGGGEVHVFVSLRVAVHAQHHARPWPRQHETAALAGIGLGSVRSDDPRFYAEER